MKHPISLKKSSVSIAPAFALIVLVTSTLLASVSFAYAQTLLIPVPLAEPSASSNITQTPEPERWTKEDLTWEEQYSTAKKETLAAYQEAKSECQILSQPEQSFCLIQAKNVMDKEMVAINKRFGKPE